MLGNIIGGEGSEYVLPPLTNLNRGQRKRLVSLFHKGHAWASDEENRNVGRIRFALLLEVVAGRVRIVSRYGSVFGCRWLRLIACNRAASISLKRM
jgi:hypothetical protein